MKWSDLTVTPDDDAVSMLRFSWHWLLGAEWTPLLFSVFGDAFIDRKGQVEWLNTGTGEITPVAQDWKSFQIALGGDSADDWFMPSLVEGLHNAGMRPGASECFTYGIYPVFAEGKYEISNFAVVPAKEHFGLSGDLHRQILGLADGDKVIMQVAP